MTCGGPLARVGSAAGRVWLLLLAWALAWALALVSGSAGGATADARAGAGDDTAGGAAPIVLLSTPLVPPARLAGLQAAAAKAGVPLRVVRAAQDDAEALMHALDGAGLLLVDAPHASVAQAAATRFGAAISQRATPYVLIGEAESVLRGQPAAVPPLAIERGVDAAWAQRLRAYWRYGGAANTAAAMAALQRIGDMAGLPEPVELPAAGFYHPSWPRIEPNIAALADLPPPRTGLAGPFTTGSGAPAAAAPPTVAIAVNAATFVSGDTEWLDALIEALAVRGMRAYAFYGPRQQADLYVRMTHTAATGNPPAVRQADLLINAALVFNPNERKAELERIGVPVLQTLPALAMDAAQWAQSKDGLASSDVAFYYVPSELAGMIDPMLVTARDATTGVQQPLPLQIASVADKAAAMLRLQRTPASQRRVAVLVYNYPPGEANFGASFLNVPRSIDRMLAAMSAAGYRTGAPGVDELIAQVQATLSASYDTSQFQPLLDRDLADSLPLARYLAWFRALPAATQQHIEAWWGPPERSAMLATVAGEPAFVIPRVRYGHVVVMRQPGRMEPGADAARRSAQLYHREAIPLSHGYLATYLWMRLQFGAQAVVHVGTHGTLEWSPGKQRGLSALDDPLLALGDLPNVYPYIMDNLGEATTAKRRGRATMVSHSTPMFSPAGFRPEAAALHERMHDWETLSPGAVKSALEARLTADFVAQHYDRDLHWTSQRIRADFAGFMAVLHPYLDELAQTAQPLGLATFGETPVAERRRSTILQILRKPLGAALGEDPEEALLVDARQLAATRMARWVERALVDADAASREGRDAPTLLALAQQAQRLDAVMAHNEELEGFLAALDGRYVASRYGGDPVRNPDSLPTGRNLHGFDPSRVPTRAAWDIGVQAMDIWVAQHAVAHGGRAPEKIAFTLWAGETLRHQGVMEAQALHAMGVRPRWDDGGRVIGIDVLPAAELRRPRIDVLVSVTGSYRDQFPNVMRWLDEAARRVAALDEPDNAVARHSRAMARRLAAEGAEPQDAQRWSTARVFSNAQGSYGAGLEETALATDLWRGQQRAGGDAQMAGLFIDRMGHAYGEGLGGTARHAAFEANLSQVDAALLSRTSNTYGMLTSDDPFQYLGGLSQAVRHLTGRDPALYVQNLRGGQGEVRTDTADGAIAREMQTRYLHPQWIAAQRAEGYSGALQVLKTAQFLWGWQVTAPQVVRPDQWQSLHDVYVRDRGRLGTREWLEGSNRAAFAQTLERMLDAVRLGYWQPDAATRRELVRTYDIAARASGLKERNVEVARFAAADLLAGRVAPVYATVAAVAPVAPVVSAAPAAEPVQGLRLERVPDAATPSAESVVGRLWLAFGVALWMALGGLVQWHLGRLGRRGLHRSAPVAGGAA